MSKLTLVCAAVICFFLTTPALSAYTNFFYVIKNESSKELNLFMTSVSCYVEATPPQPQLVYPRIPHKISVPPKNSIAVTVACPNEADMYITNSDKQYIFVYIDDFDLSNLKAKAFTRDKAAKNWAFTCHDPSYTCEGWKLTYKGD